MEIPPSLMRPPPSPIEDWTSNQFKLYQTIRHQLINEIPIGETRSEAPTSVRLEEKGGLLLDALCRHREILRRETDFLRAEVTSRGFATFAGKKNYMVSQSNLSGFSELSGSRIIESVAVRLPHLVTAPQESLDLLLHESHHLRYRIQSLASILKEFSIPISSTKVKMQLFGMSHAALIISKTLQHYATTSHSLHRVPWESVWASGMSDLHGDFDDITTLSSMLFTPSTPGIPPSSATICPALQIYSFKIVQLNFNLKWPLRVYGIVAARDTVDHNRNVLFYRSRANYQLVTENDPFLHLTGPSRAIVAVNPVIFEVKLKIECPGADHPFFFYRTYHWRSMRDTTPLFMGYSASAELSLEQLPRAIQATIVGVRLVKGKWPPSHGCRVSCSLSTAEDMEVELLNCSSLDEVKKSHVGSDGYFGLARNVVSAQLESTLKVVIQSTMKTRSGGPRTHVKFPVKQYCQTSKASCSVANCQVEVVVAWSLLYLGQDGSHA